MTDSIKKDDKATSEAQTAHATSKEEASYEVGYGKPPKEHRFKPGQSGNPGGRRKGTKNTLTILREILDSTIKIRDGEKVCWITKRQAVIELTFARALKQDPKAFGNLMKLLKDVGEFSLEADSGFKGGCFVLPIKPETPEEWQRIYGEAAKGTPIPQEIVDLVNKKTRRTH